MADDHDIGKGHDIISETRPLPVVSSFNLPATYLLPSSFPYYFRPSFVCCTLRLIKSGLEGHAGLKNTCCIIKTLRSLTRALEYKMNASQPCDMYIVRVQQKPEKEREHNNSSGHYTLSRRPSSRTNRVAWCRQPRRCAAWWLRRRVQANTM